MSCFQECSQKRRNIFNRVLAELGQSKKSEERFREERDAARKISVDQKTALATVQSDIARLNGELRKVQAAMSEMKTRFIEATKKQKETLDQSEARAHAAETEVALLRSKQDAWLTELTGLNRDMNSKCTEFSFFVFHFCRYCLMACPCDSSPFSRTL